MNAHPLLHGRPREDSAEIRPAQGSPLTLWVCGALVAVCSAAAVMLALPHVLDAGAEPAAGARAVTPSDAPKASLHERHPAQGTTEWVDTPGEMDLAQWRMRASD